MKDGRTNANAHPLHYHPSPVSILHKLHTFIACNYTSSLYISYFTYLPWPPMPQCSQKSGRRKERQGWSLPRQPALPRGALHTAEREGGKGAGKGKGKARQGVGEGTLVLGCGLPACRVDFALSLPIRIGFALHIYCIQGQYYSNFFANYLGNRYIYIYMCVCTWGLWAFRRQVIGKSSFFLKKLGSKKS